MKRQIKDKIMALISVKKQLYDEYKNHDEYGEIIHFFMTKDFLNDDNYSLPSLKKINEKTGISYHKVRSRIHKLYDELFDYEKEFSFQYDEIEILCMTKIWDESATFRLKGLKHIPKIGEEMDLFFLRGKFYTSLFHVERVTHEFEDKKQIIILHLAEGTYNPYWHFRKAEAYEKGKYPHMNIIVYLTMN